MAVDPPTNDRPDAVTTPASTREPRPVPELAVVGLGAMGAALARNIARTGRRVVVQNRTRAKTDQLIEEHGHEGQLDGVDGLDDVVAALSSPRIVIVMVAAGDPVEAVLADLLPQLDRGDVVIDAGNAHFDDTDRRARTAGDAGIGYLGLGVSGGEDGALHGPSLMAGGDRVAYDLVEPVLTDIAAQADDGTPCRAYFGTGGAGHFVKMVHNGIEYADMGAIAEVVALLRNAGRSTSAIADTFEQWGDGRLGSYLTEITVTVLRTPDDLAEGDDAPPLVDMIDDAAAQKGTGRWTAIDALELGEPATTIVEATAHRSLSSMRDRRARVRRAAAEIGGTRTHHGSPTTLDPELEAHAADALLATRLVALAQGFDVLAAGAAERDWDLRLEDVAAVWRAGCIIRSQLLDTVRVALAQYGAHLLVAPSVGEMVIGSDRGWRRTITSAIDRGVPVPVLGSALAWYDALLTERLPTALVQAQRDVFGAHTYRRIDRDGDFHTAW